MKNKFGISVLLLPIVLLLPFFGTAQSGGDFMIAKAALTSGGGAGSDAGNTFSTATVIGQTAAGTRLAGQSFNIGTGLFPPPPLAPTAAEAFIRGRVLGPNDNGIKNVFVSLSGGSLNAPRVTMTNQFGYFIFSNVEVGQFYTIQVAHKKYIFNQNKHSLMLLEDVEDLIFRADFEN